ncbi:MAG: diphthine--ammonia ligase [Flavobacteriales bacterium]|nr:diphthine--ammonia ligase [Flavobacteriales bacterium]
MREKAIMFWSGGKDSAFALYKILQEDKYQVVTLITTINKEFDRVSMHGVRAELIEEQASSIGIPLHKMYVDGGSYNEYEEKLTSVLQEFVKQGIYKVIYGDIFLEDLKEYRDNLLLQVGMAGVYPLWQRSTSAIIVEFLDLEFSTTTCCVYTKFLTKKEVGQLVDKQFVDGLNSSVDPCGENGEFHTFCWNGPIFKYPVPFSLGEKVFKPIQMPKETESKGVEGFWFCDLLSID